LAPETFSGLTYSANSRSYGLGFEFTDTLDAYFQKISRLPTASAIRYDNVRVKPIDTFPYTIHFTIEGNASVIILRVFNTYRDPFH
jgi:hypothetical protein